MPHLLNGHFRLIVALLILPVALASCKGVGPTQHTVAVPQTMTGAKAAYEDGRYVEALAGFRKLASSGSAEALYYLGEMHRLALTDETADSSGEYRRSDLGTALRYYRKSAEEGYAQAALRLGIMYERGAGVDKEYVKAADWYRKSSDLGNSFAGAKLGHLYLKGQGVDQNYDKALELLRKGADSGIMEAQFYLGQMHEEGRGVDADREQALKWYKKAEQSGSGRAARARQELADQSQVPRRSNQQASRSDGAEGKGTTGERKISTGTGLYINKRHVVTNAHVIETCDTVRIKGKGRARVVSVDRASDLAVLQTPNTAASGYLKFRGGQGVRPGERVIVVSYPLQGIVTSNATITTGNVSALAGPGNDRRLIQITAPVQSGSSGAPVLDMSGHVVGVVVAKLDALSVAKVTGEIPQNVNFAVNSNIVTTLLDANGIQYRKEKSIRSRSAPDVASSANPYTRVIECWN